MRMRVRWVVAFLCLLAVVLWQLLADDSAFERAERTRRPEATIEDSRGHASDAGGADEAITPAQPAGAPSTDERTLSGVVTTEAGSPLWGVTVSLAIRDGMRATTTADGTYILKGVPSGSYPVEAVAPGYARAAKQVSVVTPDTRVDFVLREGRPLFGRVVDQLEQPVHGARLWASLASDQSTGLQSRESDPDGTFHFDDSYEGRWWLHLSPPEAGEWRGSRAILVSPADSPFDLRIVRFPPGETDLIVEVVDAATGQSIEAKQVMLYRQGDWSMDTRRPVETGQGVIRGHGLGRGLWRLEFSTDMGRMMEDIEILSGIAVERRRIRIERCVVAGHAQVEGATARPESMALTTRPAHIGKWVMPPKYECHRSTGGFALLDRDSGYTFRFDWFPSGRPVTLVVEAEGLCGLASVAASALDETQAVVMVRRAGTVSLRLKNGLAVRPCRVSFQSAGIDAWIEVGEHEGSYVSLLPAGPARWQVRYPDARTGDLRVREGDAEVIAGEITAVEVDLK